MPSGRPPGSKNKRRWTRLSAQAERAIYVDRLTDGGAFVADKMFQIANDDSHPEQIAALKWLAEHDTAGKPATTVDVDVHVTEETVTAIDYDSLSLEEAMQWKALHDKATKRLASPSVIDVESAEVA